MINRNSLIADIKSVGEIPGITQKKFRSLFSPARYAIILLAAIREPIFEDFVFSLRTASILIFINWKALLKPVAFERFRTAEKVYRYLELKRRVRFLIQNDKKTFIILTNKGEKI
jgi:hypothetical protein